MTDFALAPYCHVPLGARSRFLGALAAWGGFALGSPGMLTEDGSALLAALGVLVWGAVELRPFEPGRAGRGLLAHALGAVPGAAALMGWIWYVYPPPLLYIGFGMGVYSAAGGLLLRRLAARLPVAALPLAVAVAWTAQETLRTVVPMPFGLGWMRVGVHAHAHLWLSGSARVWGVGGLTFVLAALGGTGVLAWRARALPWAGLAWGLGPLALAAALAAAVPAPATVPGPRVLLVQPGFEQARKQYGDKRLNFLDTLARTRAAVAEESAAGNPPADLVCWGESMLPFPLFAEGVEDVLAPDGVPNRDDVAFARREESRVVVAPVRAVLPRGASFLVGSDALAVSEAGGGETEWRVAAALYGPDGKRPPLAYKQFLVPGAETMYGLERFDAVAGFIDAVSGYVPRFRPGRGTAGYDLEAADGRASWRLGVTICFDNAHLGPYADPPPGGPVDLHAVVSNEAWYRRSFEADQMVAFTRMAALASGRSVVRATNSGISLVLGPDGREVARLRDAEGEDRMVAGHLAATVPVPTPPDAGPTVLSRTRRGWLAAWILLPAALLGLFRSRRNRGAPSG